MKLSELRIVEVYKSDSHNVAIDDALHLVQNERDFMSLCSKHVRAPLRFIPLELFGVTTDQTWCPKCAGKLEKIKQSKKTK